jgi:uncharacterized membrane protein
VGWDGNVVRCTAVAGCQSIPQPTNVTLFGVLPTDLSLNGDIVVGTAETIVGRFDPNIPRAFRWMASDGMSFLNLTAGSSSSFAAAITPDGQFIVGGGDDGNGFNEPGSDAFIWDATSDQSRRISDVLTGLGVDLQGWRLTSAEAISDNGLFIAGTGIDPQGKAQAWIANLAPVPEASQWLLMLADLGIITGVSRNRKFR